MSRRRLWLNLAFLPDVNAWWKISVPGLISKDELVVRNTSVGYSSIPQRAARWRDLHHAECGQTNLPLRAWKIYSVRPNWRRSAATCYVVSIRQSWAAHFFDIPVGGQTLMDLNDRLHLGIEGAYYCSARRRTTHVTAPGRVLWYVSGKGSMSIKACSHLEERTIGKPKELFAHYRHLGVYAWKLR